MKIIKLLSNRYFLIAIFLLVIIEGEHFGGFYILYLLLALPHGALYAITALLGIAAIAIAGNKKLVDDRQNLLVLDIGGVIMLITSFIIFFSRGRNGDTFIDPIPLFTFILLSVTIIAFLLRTLNLLPAEKSRISKQV